jgi:RHS repeat-associated protein
LALSAGQNTFIVTATHPSHQFATSATNTYTNLISSADLSTNNFDGDGNVTFKTKRDGSNNVLVTQTLLWDANDRLVKVTERDSQNSGYDWTAVYDPLGRRLRTTHTPIITNTPQSGLTVLDSTYDPQVEFLEVSVVVNGERHWKVYGPDVSGRYGGMQGLGGLDAVLLDSQVGFDDAGVIADQFGNVPASVDFWTWAQTWSPTRAGAYGPASGYPALPLERNQDGFIRLGSNLAWRGMRIDPTGLYCVGARYYDPQAGRFISADPMGFAGGSDLQSFCQADPVNFFDPDGRLGTSTLSAYGKSGDFSDRMPFEYRLARIQAQAGLGGCPWCVAGPDEAWGAATASWLQSNIGAPLNSVATTSTALNFGSYMAGSFVNGAADLLRLGQGTGNALYNTDNGWDVAIGITQDIGRASGLASIAGGALIGAAGKAGIAAASAEGGGVPRGFASGEQFSQAAQELNAALAKSGIGDASIGVRGSSVTGVSARTGQPFGPASDIDFFVESRQLTEGLKTQPRIPGFVHPDRINAVFDPIAEWSEIWSENLGRPVSVGGFQPGTVPLGPVIRP